MLCSPVFFKQKAKYYKTKSKLIGLKNLDELPMPAWDLVDVDAYKKVWAERGKKISLNIATTRGCPFKCNWCAKPIYGVRYNRKESIITAEVSELLTFNLKDSVTLLLRTNPSLSFSAPYFSFFFYKQENGYEGMGGMEVISDYRESLDLIEGF